MRNNRIDISALTKRELQAVLEAANFTEMQEVIFNAMNKDYMYDLAVMQNLGISPNRYYQIKKITVNKVERIAIENGYNHAIKTVRKRL